MFETVQYLVLFVLISVIFFHSLRANDKCFEERIDIVNNKITPMAMWLISHGYSSDPLWARLEKVSYFKHFFCVFLFVDRDKLYDFHNIPQIPLDHDP